MQQQGAGRDETVSRKTTDDEIGNGHIDFTDCEVWYDKNGYTVIDRYGNDRAMETKKVDWEEGDCR